MVKILMVCLGNICRSPLAEGILQSKLAKKSFFVDSAGTADFNIGRPPDKRSIMIAKKYGIDISHLRGRQFTADDFDKFDIIYVMDESNYHNVINLARNSKDIAKVNYILNEIYPKQNYNIRDPYLSDMAGFDSAFKILDEACSVIADKLTSH